MSWRQPAVNSKQANKKKRRRGHAETPRREDTGRAGDAGGGGHKESISPEPCGKCCLDFCFPSSLIYQGPYTSTSTTSLASSVFKNPLTSSCSNFGSFASITRKKRSRVA